MVLIDIGCWKLDINRRNRRRECERDRMKHGARGWSQRVASMFRRVGRKKESESVCMCVGMSMGMSARVCVWMSVSMCLCVWLCAFVSECALVHECLCVCLYVWEWPCVRLCEWCSQVLQNVFKVNYIYPFVPIVPTDELSSVLLISTQSSKEG